MQANKDEYAKCANAPTLAIWVLTVVLALGFAAYVFAQGSGGGGQEPAPCSVANQLGGCNGGCPRGTPCCVGQTFNNQFLCSGCFPGPDKWCFCLTLGPNGDIIVTYSFIDKNGNCKNTRPRTTCYKPAAGACSQ